MLIMMLEILKGGFSNTSVEAVAGALCSLGGLCFLGFVAILFIPS